MTKQSSYYQRKGDITFEEKSMKYPSEAEFSKGVDVFGKKESRNAVYEVVTFWLQNYCGDWNKIAHGIAILLLSWNKAFYRMKDLKDINWNKLSEFLEKNKSIIEGYRDKQIENIETLETADEIQIKSLFYKIIIYIKL